MLAQISRVGKVRSRLAQLVGLHDVDNRAALAAATGLSPSTVGTHIDALIGHGLIREIGSAPEGARGRPSYRLGIDPSYGSVMVAELGTQGAQVAVGNIGGALRSDLIDIDVTAGPGPVLAQVAAALESRLAENGTDMSTMRALVVALPGPVDQVTGAPVQPSLMPGWDGYPVAAEMGARFGCRVEVHNDVNMMAAGEALTSTPDEFPMIYLKIGSSVGCGVILHDGSLLHGRTGAAGDIAHLPAAGGSTVLCACGNRGCIEAVASTGAIFRELERVPGLLTDEPKTVHTLVELIQRREPNAVRAVRDAAEILGHAAVVLVHLFNPATIVIGGPTASDDVVAGIRGIVYQRALPLATSGLHIRLDKLGQRTGLMGCFRRAREMAVDAESITQLMAEDVRPATSAVAPRAR